MILYIYALLEDRGVSETGLSYLQAGIYALIDACCVVICFLAANRIYAVYFFTPPDVDVSCIELDAAVAPVTARRGRRAGNGG